MEVTVHGITGDFGRNFPQDREGGARFYRWEAPYSLDILDELIDAVESEGPPLRLVTD